MRIARWFAGFSRGAALIAAGLTAACSGEAEAPALSPTASATASATAAASAGPRQCVIDGTVKGPSGAAVAGALVAVVASYTAREAALTRSDASGGFCFGGLPAGEYGLTLTSSGLTSAHVDVLPIGGDRGHGLAVQLAGEGFTLCGTIRDASGKQGGKHPVRIARISSAPADTFVVESDEQGRYAVKLPAAKSLVQVEEDDAKGLSGPLTLARDEVADVALSPLNPRPWPPPAEVVEWLKNKAIPLTKSEAGRGFADMEPVRAVVGSARLVTLGEATHGTHELFQMKHRMFELLVEQMSFRTFAIEASFPETLTRFTVGPASSGILDGAFALAGLPLFEVDLRSASGAARPSGRPWGSR